jgi:uncharacterized cupin superfamily protein
MKQTNQNQVEWVETKSPKGKFHLFRRHLSLALGGKKDTGTWGGGHPFDLELTRIPPGATNWPYHAHAVQWELYVIISGHGHARSPEGESPIVAGDCFIYPPGEPHQIRNTGKEDLIYYVIADNPPVEVSNYPDSGKLSLKQFLNGQFKRDIFKINEVDYFQGEE